MRRCFSNNRTKNKYCFWEEESDCVPNTVGHDANGCAVMEGGGEMHPPPRGGGLRIPARSAARRCGYFPRRTAIVYTSGSRTEAARRFTSERLTAAIFSGAENVSSYPVPYSSL
jgi:hypothetical protein